MPSKTDHQNKAFTEILAYVKSIDEESRRVRFIISTDKVDRDGDRIETSAIAAAIKDFAKNPTALACHQHRLANGDSPVVGSWDTDSFKATAHASEMDLVFAKTDLGEQYWTLYKDKHMRAVSIGFSILDAHEEVVKINRIRVITRIELYEISCVPVGSNRQALAKANLNLPIEGELLTAGPDVKEIQAAINEKFEALEEQLDEIKNLFIDDHGNLAKSLLGNDDAENISGRDDAELTKAEANDILTKLKNIADGNN